METANQNAIESSRKNQFILTSFALYFCYIAYGLAYNIWGPTWVDLVSLLNSTQDEMAYGNSLMAIGYTIGAFSGGFMFNYLNRQLLVVFYLLLMAVSTSLTPVLKSYTIFLVLSVIFGLGEGGFDTACNAWILEMWREENGPYMQAMYFTFGLGALLAPLISLRFMDDSNDMPDNSVTNMTFESRYSMQNMTINTPQFGAHHHNYIYSHKFLSPLMPRINDSLNISRYDNTTTGIKTSTIYIPYCITGALLAVSALIVIMMYFIKKYEPILDSDNEIRCEESTERKVYTDIVEDTDSAQLLNTNMKTKLLVSVRDKENISKRYLISMVLVGGIMFCFYEGMENINFEYLSTFCVNTKLNLSEETSDLILSAMSASYTIGRGIGIIVAIKVNPKYFLYCDLILISIGNVILYFFANSSETMVYIGTVILGLGFATVFPCIYSYMEQHIRLTNIICGILMVSCSSIATVDPIIVGRYITANPYILLYVNIGSTVLVVMAFITIEVIAIVRRQRQLSKHCPLTQSTSDAETTDLT